MGVLKKYVHNHARPIFGTHVYLNMLINVPFFLVPLRSKENALFIFLVQKTVIFQLFSAKIVKEVPNILISSGPHHPGWGVGDIWFTL